MKEHKQPDLSAASMTEPGMAESIKRFHEEFSIPPDSYPLAAPVAMSQPDNVDLNEMLLRFRRREL